MEKEKNKKSIFIIDDDSFLLDMYALRFTQAGFQVETAMNAEQALEKLRSGLVPDIVLLDIVMPIMDGFELLEAINTEKLISGSLKIILSNLGQQQDFDRGKELGAHSYIVKANSTPSEVVAHVNDVLKEHGK
jgi:DNA-binding response OmpR family regulator